MASETGKSSNGETPRAKRAGSGPESSGLVAFTLDVKSGRIMKVEAVESDGERRDLDAEETSRLAARGGSTLEDVLERAFEAGVSSVLNGETGEDLEVELETEEETEEESALRRAILRSMIERSAARHLLSREVLGRAILGTLIQDAAAAQTSATAPKAGPPPSRPAAGGPRRPPPRGRPH